MKITTKGIESWLRLSHGTGYIIDRIAPRARLAGDNDLLRCRVFAVILFSIFCLWCLLSLTLGQLLPLGSRGAVVAQQLMLSLGLGCLLVLGCYRLTGRRVMAAHLLGGVIWCLLMVAASRSGGIETPVLPLFCILPVMLGITAGTRSGLYWMLLVFATWWGLLSMDSAGYEFEQVLEPGSHSRALALCLCLTSAVLVIMLLQYEFINHSLRDGLDRERENFEYLARHDQLTGLPNRFSFARHWDLALGRARRSRTRVAILFLDLDRFKQINDQWGHKVGDQVLQVMAARLRGLLRTTDFVARWGGDEFAMIIEHLGSPQALEQVADKLVQLIRRPVAISGETYYLDVSIGAAIFPDQGEEADVLERKADQAMYVAKQGVRRYVLCPGA